MGRVTHIEYRSASPAQSQTTSGSCQRFVVKCGDNPQVAKSRSAGILMVREHDAKCAPGRRGRETFRWLIILSFLPGMLVLMIVFGLFARDVPAGFPIWICGAWLTGYVVTE